METLHVPDMTNQEFLEAYACPGRIGLVGGTALIELMIKRAQRHLLPDRSWSLWSHALLFEGRRPDGHHWVMESDLEIGVKHTRLGVQENRISKYFQEEEFPVLAVLDFGLTPEQVATVLREGLEMVAGRARYSLRELFGAAVALHNPWFRGKKNLLAQENSVYCSGFVQYVFGKAGIELVPGVHASHGSPEDISQSPWPHRTWLLRRDPEQRTGD